MTKPAERVDEEYGLTAALVAVKKQMPDGRARVWAELIATVEPLCVPRNAGLYTEIRVHHDPTGSPLASARGVD